MSEKHFFQNLADVETSECLYGFQRKFFLDTLFTKAERLYPNVSKDVIWNYQVPKILDQLYDSMDQGDLTLFHELIEIEKKIIKNGQSKPTCEQIEKKTSKENVTSCIVEERSGVSTKATENLIKALLEQKESVEKNGVARRCQIPIHRPIRIPKKSSKKTAHQSTPIQKRKIQENSEEKHCEFKKKAKMQKGRTDAISENVPDHFGELHLDQISVYDIPVEIFQIEAGENDSHLAFISNMIEKSASDAEQYIRSYASLLYLEEAAEILNLQQYNEQSIQLSYSNSGRIFQIKIDKNTKKIAQAIDESLLVQFWLRSSHQFRPRMAFSGIITRCDKENIYVEICDKDCINLKRYCKEQSFDISFKINNLPYRIQHKILEYIEMYNLHSLLIANKKYDSNYGGLEQGLDNTMDYNFSGNLAKNLNDEQKVAVISILKMNKSLPYLLFGPAGTGKTRTLVAVIEEIVRSTDKFILVCTNSNAASDEIAQRLLTVLHSGEMIRIYAKSFNAAKMISDLKQCSNLKNGEFKYPCLNYIYGYRVVICTLLTAGNLMRARSDPNFNANHFEYVIIDECASTNEISTLIPIAGLCCTESGIQANVILAGDPRQLDAVSKSVAAANLGYKTSFMERLFKRPLYSKHLDTGKFNSCYITQLVRNYRSHVAILHVANVLFYGGSLISSASEATTNWFMNSRILPNKDVPIVFKAVNGISSISENDCSLFNMKEARAVVDQIKELLRPEEKINGKQIKQSDIGVVTPYKLQCKIITRICAKLGFSDIDIGTAEVFQGKEKPVMIVSTVRTGGTMGFVNSALRCNVVLTRAKCLLIIFGDPHTLYTDRNWRYLLEFCELNGSFIQAPDNPFNFEEDIKEVDQSGE